MPGSESLTPSDPASFGEYSVVGRLGKGGQGVVYLGQDGDGEMYAIKVLNEEWAQNQELRKRFEKEVRAAQKVASFCTAAIHEANLHEDPPYVVSEYVEGASLQESVSRDGPHKGASLQRLAVSTATALVAIHQAGIVHRDFKPGNVLLGSGGPRVIDFGIARMSDTTATVTNSVVGTPSYMAPEQIEGQEITDRADIFAWGCIMAFASTGAAPFGADSVPAVVHRVVSAPPNLDGVPQSMIPIVEACLNKDPNQRPNAQTLLMRLLGHDPGGNESPEAVVKEGERAAETGTFGAVSGPQAPPVPPAPGTPSGPQTPFPQQQGGMGRPVSGPQQGGFAPQQPPVGPRMPGPGAGGPTGPRPGAMPGPPPPPPQAPQATGPNTMYGAPGMHTQQPHPPMPPQKQAQGPREDPVLSQGWIVPAVLIAIIILLLLLVLISLSGG